jgi:hypothetical protein
MATERKTIHLGEVRLAGYAGVGEARPPSRLTVYGFVIPGGGDGRPVHWSTRTRPDEDECWNLRLYPDQTPKYSCTVLVPTIMFGTLADRWPTIEEECERLRREYRRAARAR